MSYGLSVNGLILDENYSNYMLYSTGVARGYKNNQFGVVQVYISIIKLSHESDLISINEGEGFVGIYKRQNLDLYVASDTPSFTYNIWSCINRPKTNERYGIQVIDSSGLVTFDSRQRYMKILNVTTNIDPVSPTDLIIKGGDSIVLPMPMPCYTLKGGGLQLEELLYQPASGPGSLLEPVRDDFSEVAPSPYDMQQMAAQLMPSIYEEYDRIANDSFNTKINWEFSGINRPCIFDLLFVQLVQYKNSIVSFRPCIFEYKVTAFSMEALSSWANYDWYSSGISSPVGYERSYADVIKRNNTSTIFIAKHIN